MSENVAVTGAAAPSHSWRWSPPEDTWLVRLFDYKPFLAALCLFPAIALLVVFLTYPLGLGVYLAFTDTRIGRAGEWIGLENFDSLWHDRVFWLSVTNTLFYTGVATVGKFGLGLWLALLLNHNLPFKSLIRAIVLVPWIVPTVLSAVAFWWIYDPQFSIISYVLKSAGLISSNIDFLGTPWHARLSLVAANIWRGIPFVAISLLAGLQTISPSLYEAALLDGATAWQRFVKITVPMLMPVLSVVLTFSRVVHLHRLPAGICDHPRRPGELDPSDGDARVPARHPGRPARRGRGDRGGDDPVPGRGHAAQLFRAGAPAQWQQGEGND